MKNIYKKCVLYVLVGLSMLQFHVYAFASEWTNIKELPSISEFSGDKQARVVGAPRGRLISSIELQLTDKGSGTAGIYADLLCHEPMKYLKMWIFLERWDELEESWSIIHDQELTWLAEDYPNEDLTMAVAGYDVSGLERGQYYRLRGLFAAKDLNTGYQESWQTTSGDLYFE